MSTADEEDSEGKKGETPERMDLLPSSAREERPIGASYHQNMARDHGGPIGANRKDKPKKSTPDEEDRGKKGGDT